MNAPADATTTCVRHSEPILAQNLRIGLGRCLFSTLTKNCHFDRSAQRAVEKPATHSRQTVWLAIFVLGFALLPPPTHAQGCTQCRDNTAATSPATQRAYRHAIILMSAAAASLFLTTLIILKRNS